MKKHLVLVIDDNEETCEKTKGILQLEDYNVSIAHKGQEALDMIQKDSFQLVLCEVQLPDMSGYDILKKLSAHPETSIIPVVLMSSETRDLSFRNAMNNGAADYLSKPFKGEDLLSIVDVRIHRQDIYKASLTKETEIFDELSYVWEQDIQDHQLFKNRTIKELHAKEILFHEGDFGAYIYYILSGKINTFKSTDSGRNILTDICLQGEFLGYSIVFSSPLFQESAVAQEDSLVMLIPKNDFVDCLYKDKQIFMKFAQDLSIRIHQSELQLMNLAYNSARKRVSDAILFVFEKYNKSKAFDTPVPFSRSTLSSLAAVSNECVSRNLTDFRNEGLIRLNKKRIFILNFDKLKNVRN